MTSGSTPCRAHGRTLVLAQWASPRVAVVDLATRTAREVIFDAPPFTMGFSPDGRRLVVLYVNSNTWGVADTASLRSGRLEYVRAPVTFPGNPFWDVSYSGDGTQLVTTGSGAVELWDAESLEHVATLTAGSQDDIASARAMADGHTILLAHPRGQVLRWDIRPEKVLDFACALAGRNLSADEWDRYVGQGSYRPTCPDPA